MEYFQRQSLNVNRLLTKTDEICFTGKQSNASINGISEFKLDSSFLNSEVDILGYQIFRLNR